MLAVIVLSLTLPPCISYLTDVVFAHRPEHTEGVDKFVVHGHPMSLEDSVATPIF